MHVCSCEGIKVESTHVRVVCNVLFPCAASWIIAMAETITEINCEMKEGKETSSGDEILESTFYFVYCYLVQDSHLPLHFMFKHYKIRGIQI